MVRLTVTGALLETLRYCEKHHVKIPFSKDIDLSNAKLGSPISHDQIIAISTLLKERTKIRQDPDIPDHDLKALLKGSYVYIEPPKPKPEPTNEYKQLMARLREEEEERAYDRMISPPAPKENPMHLFPSVSKQEEDEEVTFADINRQVTLIFNILISIVACAVAIWIATRYWPIPQRLGISMGGGGLVGVAEVVVYAGYLRRVKEAKQKEKRKVEKKQIIDTWVIEPKQDAGIQDTNEKIIKPTADKTAVRQRINAKS